jgi:hypothetical protein
MNFIRLPLPKVPTFLRPRHAGEHLAAALERRLVAAGEDDEV